MIDGSCRGSAAACVSPQKCLTLVFCVTADRFVQAIREVLRQSTDLEARGIRLFASTAELVLLLLQKKIAPGVEEPAERQLDGLLELLQEILPLLAFARACAHDARCLAAVFADTMLSDKRSVRWDWLKMGG
jgi:hypothetical protein